MKRTLVFAVLLVLAACQVSPRSAMFDPYHVPSSADVSAAGGDAGDGSSGSSD